MESSEKENEKKTYKFCDLSITDYTSYNLLDKLILFIYYSAFRILDCKDPPKISYWDYDIYFQTIFYKFIKEIGLKKEEIVMVYIYLKRHLKYINDKQPDTKLKILTLDDIIFCIYFSQSLIYDEPLDKKVWLQYSTINNWSKFVDEMLNFYKTLNYNMIFTDNEFNESAIELLEIRKSDIIEQIKEDKKLKSKVQ